MSRRQHISVRSDYEVQPQPPDAASRGSRGNKRKPRRQSNSRDRNSLYPSPTPSGSLSRSSSVESVASNASNSSVRGRGSRGRRGRGRHISTEESYGRSSMDYGEGGRNIAPKEHGQAGQNGSSEVKFGNARGRGGGRGRGTSHNGQSNDAGDRRTHILNFNQLEKLLNQEPSDIILSLVAPRSGLEERLSNHRLQPQMTVQVLKLLARALKSNIHPENQHSLMGTLLESNLFSVHVTMVVGSLIAQKDDQDVFDNLISIFRSFLRRMPVAAAEKLKECATFCVQIMRAQSDAVAVQTGLKTAMAEIENNMREVLAEKAKQAHEKAKKRTKVDEVEDDEPPEDFREISITPHLQEITSNIRPFLRKNIVRGSFKNWDHYLDIQFRLLREDFVAPLRKGIVDYLHQHFSKGNKKENKIKDIRVYKGVKIADAILRRDGIYYEISFDITPFKKIRWEVSGRLINGSLLCLTADEFGTVRFATVAIRDPEKLKQGKVGVKFEGDHDEKLELSKREKSLVYVMAESQAYFEAYRHILLGLQQIKSEMPLKNHIVDIQRHLEPPKYLDYNSTYDMSCVLAKNNNVRYKATLGVFFTQRMSMIAGHRDYLQDALNEEKEECSCFEKIDLFRASVLDVRTWPSGEELGLDDSQKRAMHLALTSSLAVIQGPPGTGKTYVGLKIVKTLLNNRNVWKDGEATNSAPILVVCLTNHALDQFLEGITSYTTRLVRVGNRSKSEKLDRYNLRYIRDHIVNDRLRAPNIHFNVKDLEYRLRNIRGEMEKQQFKIQWLSMYVLHETALTMLTGEDSRLAQSLKDGFAEAFGVQPEGEPWCPRSFLAAWLGLTFQQFVTEDDIEEFRIVDENDFQEVGAPKYAKPSQTEVFALPAPNAAKEEMDAIDSDDEFIDIEDEVTAALRNRLLDDDAPEIVAFAIPSDEASWAVHVESLSNPAYHCPDGVNIHPNMLHLYSRMGQLRREIAERELQKREKMSDVEVTFEVENAWNLTLRDRWRLYRRWVDIFRVVGMENLNSLQEKYNSTAKRLKEVINGEDLAILRQSDVVGMTTTGAAKYHQVLQELGPKIVIVEEAAEVLESHIVTTLSQNTEHLILIGDHQQLRPTTSVYKLATEYHLDVSLFERMIMNGVRYETLQLQHRMRPEISRLIVPLIYPNLEDHPSVRQYSKIKGLSKSMFFLSHSCNEEAVADSMTHANQFEAEFLAGLCLYLMQQGYEREKITILTTYSGQLFALRRLMKRETYEGVRVMVVDNYQGEENDIILLSFVRSNDEGKIGFLKIENRVNVALSRARKGLYCVGNFSFLASKSDLWRKLVADLERDESIGPAIELKCQKHADSLTKVSKAADFISLAPEGGCLQLCNEIQECGHTCQRVCHLDEHLKCTQRCSKILCALNHQCPLLCFQTCVQCKVPVRKAFESCEHSVLLPCHRDISEVKCKTKVERTLSKCNHTVKLECHIEPDTYKCRHMVKRVLPHCQHQREVECYLDPATVSCLEECDYRLDCGHVCPRTCHPLDDSEHNEVICLKPCQKKICELEHKCKMLCHQQCNKCAVLVHKELPCGHSDYVPCSQDVESVVCNKNCQRTMACTHRCKLKCKDLCGQCTVIVDKVIPNCSHMVRIKCMDDPAREVCKKKCNRTLSCGHNCTKMCCVPCTTECKHPVPATGLCGHSSTVPCHAKNCSQMMMSLFCQTPCGRMLPCDHQCKGTCGECRQGRVHVPCREKCGRVQICGHECEAPCSKACIPCKRKCPTRCGHSRCPKKCGQPCKKCNESCKWRCRHLHCDKRCGELCVRPRCNEPCTRKLNCGHSCIGLCGEICPKLCRDCDRGQLTDFILFGFEEDEDARFIQLEDCGHCIEIRAMDHWMDMDENEIQMKGCPRCKTTIWRSRRYGNVIRIKMLDVQKVKRQSFGGSNKLLRASQNRLLHSLRTKYSIQENFSNEVHILTMLLRNQFVLHQNQLVVVENQINILELMAKMKGKVKRMSTEANEYFNADLKLLSQRLMQNEEHISEHELKQINQEVRRLYLQAAAIDAEKRLPSIQGNLEAVGQLEQAKLMLSHCCTLSDREEKTIELSLEAVMQMQGGLGISDRERVQIVTAMNLTSGHWYKCPNGHVYAIGDCGQANQIGRCPECGAQIGGVSHRLSAGNVPTSEMVH